MKISEWPLLQAPLYLNWNLTYRCQFHCRHCYSRERLIADEMTTEEKMMVADNIIKNNIFYVNFGGGEPFCSKDCIPMIRKLSSAGIWVNVSTNGWNISDEMADEVAAAGIGGVIVSIDSTDAAVHDYIRNQPGSFESMLASVKKFTDRNVQVSVSTVITKKNVYQLEEILALAAELKCSNIELKRMKMEGNALKSTDLALDKEDEEYLYANIRGWREKYKELFIRLIYSPKAVEDLDAGCPCGKSVLTILGNGGISACAYSPVILGNAVKDDIGEIWRESSQLHKMRKENTCPGLGGIV